VQSEEHGISGKEEGNIKTQSVVGKEEKSESDFCGMTIEP
jgi:hypothetical protein